MKTLPYIEDYIDLMADHVLTWPPKDPVIKLARYDEPIVNSMGEQIQRQQGFTDKQAVLAHKIVTKYRKQWAAAGYSIDHQVEPKFRFPIRTIDRSQHIEVVDGDIEIRFPYNQELIGHVRAAVSELPGKLLFDKDKRCWLSSLIEPRLIWAKEFGAKYNFSFGPEFNQCLESMLSQEDYAIQLRYNGTDFEITNAADSLCDYINSNGGFGTGNLARLIDLAGICGYTVDNTVYNHLPEEIDAVVLELLLGRDINLQYEIGADLDLTAVQKYAAMTNRYPIYVYESGSSQLRQALEQCWLPDQILDLKNMPAAAHHNQPVVYFNHWKLAQVNVPLLVTSHTLMIGSRRQQMLQSAQKIIYYSQRILDNASMPTTDT